MDFDDVYTQHKARLQGAAARETACRRKLETYMAAHESEVLDGGRNSSGRIVLVDRPSSTISARGMDFRWKFWNGVGHHNHPEQTNMSAQITWAPSDPDAVRVSGQGIADNAIDLDDFIALDLVEHMAIAMSEALLTSAKQKHPHIT